MIRVDIRENRGGEFFIYEHNKFNDEEVVKIGHNLISSSSAIIPSVDPMVGV